MPRTELIVIIVVVIAAVAYLALRGSGLRVTEITRTVRRDEDDEDRNA